MLGHVARDQPPAPRRPAQPEAPLVHQVDLEEEPVLAVVLGGVGRADQVDLVLEVDVQRSPVAPEPELINLG